MRERVEALIGDDGRGRVALDVPLALRAAAAPRGAEDRAVARLRHLRLVRPGRGREAGASASWASTTSSCRRAWRCRGSARPRTAWKGPSRCAAPGTSATSRSPRSTSATSQALKDANALDFDDLLLKTVELFETSRAGARSSTRSKFKYVMVDEYQDTNRPQYLLIRRLAEAHRNLAVVGDPDQSIYKWRGADLRNILDFEQRLPRGQDRPARAELPLDAGDPRRRVRGHQPEPQPQGQAAVDRPQGRLEDRLLPRQRRARGGRLHHPLDQAVPLGRRRRHDGGPLPHQRAVARD